MARQSNVRSAGIIVLGGLLLSLGSACVHDLDPTSLDEHDASSDAAPEPPDNDPVSSAADGLLVATVRVHALRSELSDALNSSLSDDEIRDRFAEVNRIWERANIRFDIESIQRPPAQQEAAFEDLIASGAKKAGSLLGQLYPPSNLLSDGWNLVLLEDFGAMPPGVYSCNTKVVIAARYFGPNHHEAPATVLAHEFGHSLSLPHLCGQGENLMCADGMQPEKLFDEQVDAAREQLKLQHPAHCSP